MKSSSCFVRGLSAAIVCACASLSTAAIGQAPVHKPDPTDVCWNYKNDGRSDWVLDTNAVLAEAVDESGLRINSRLLNGTQRSSAPTISDSATMLRNIYLFHVLVAHFHTEQEAWKALASDQDPEEVWYSVKSVPAQEVDQDFLYAFFVYKKVLQDYAGDVSPIEVGDEGMTTAYFKMTRIITWALLKRKEAYDGNQQMASDAKDKEDFDPKKEKIYDANGMQRDWPSEVKKMKREPADWILQRWMHGEKLLVQCTVVIDPRVVRRGVAYPAVVSAGVTDTNAGTKASADLSGSEPADGWFSKAVAALPPKHWGGSADALALKDFGVSDPLASDPSISVKPVAATKTAAASYTINAQAAVGWQFTAPSKCALGSDCHPFAFSGFLDGYYGADANAPKTGKTTTIDRIGAGLDVVSMFGRGEAGTYLPQGLIEYVTDHQFHAKSLYFEGRLDMVDPPLRHHFERLIDQNAPPCSAGSSGEAGGGETFSCAAAVILDGAHTFVPGLQPLGAQFTNFARIGGEIGGKFAFAAWRDCGDSTFFCKFLLKPASLNVTYRYLHDLTNNNAEAYNFTSSLDYAVSDKGPKLSLSYTEGVETITLFKLPTWSVSLKGSL